MVGGAAAECRDTDTRHNYKYFYCNTIQLSTSPLVITRVFTLSILSIWILVLFHILTESENNFGSQIFSGGAAVLKEKIFFRAENIFVFARHFDNKCRLCSAQAGQKLEMMASNWETRVPRF